MHPAKSVIYFTTATGAGYGLLFWLGCFAWLGVLPADQMFGLVTFGIAFFLVMSGLLSSTLHLGHPERAWRALSQWRTSWLSREGLIALLTFVPTGLFALSWVFLGENQGPAAIIGLIGALMSMLTVFCTAMIYASLKAIPAWRNRWVVPGYLVFSLATGAVLLALLVATWGFSSLEHILASALSLVLLAFILKAAYWASRGSAQPRSTSGSATGLSRWGEVRLIEGPHTETNYLLEEMGYQIARKHSAKLRYSAIIMGFGIPAGMLLAALFATAVPPLIWLILGVATCTIGIVIERWLFLQRLNTWSHYIMGGNAHEHKVSFNVA